MLLRHRASLQELTAIRSRVSTAIEPLIASPQKIGWKSDGDYWLQGVARSDIENQGLVSFRCAQFWRRKGGLAALGGGVLLYCFTPSNVVIVGTEEQYD